MNQQIMRRIMRREEAAEPDQLGLAVLECGHKVETLDDVKTNCEECVEIKILQARKERIVAKRKATIAKNKTRVRTYKGIDAYYRKGGAKRHGKNRG